MTIATHKSESEYTPVGMVAYDRSRHVASDRLVTASATFMSCGHPADKTSTALDQQSNRDLALLGTE